MAMLAATYPELPSRRYSVKVCHQDWETVPCISEDEGRIPDSPAGSSPELPLGFVA